MNEKRSGCRVLLVTPPSGLWKNDVQRPWISTQPLGLAYIAAAVRDANFPVEVVDGYSMGLSGEEILARVRAFRPDLIGISVLTPQWPDTEALVDLIKQDNSEIFTVVGGPHITALPNDAAAHPSVDVCVLGEGEETIKDVCRAVAAGGSLDDVSGLVLGTDGEVRATEQRPKNMDLDNVTFPAHDLLPAPEFYNPFPSWGKKGLFSCMISGRGCPYQCCFCDVTAQQGKRYRLRSAENVVDEMTWLNRSFGVTMFSFRDPSMICNRRRLLEICRLIEERGLDIAWTCSARANEVDPEMLAAMKRSGCRLIQYGIEVGNAEMLKTIKNISRERVAKAVRDTREAGISAHGYFLFGFVEETPETIEETISFARELALDSAGFAVMVPFPGTREFENYRKEGLLLTEDWRDYNVMGKPVYRHKHITNEQLAQAPRRAYRRFYLRPGIIMQHARKMSSPRVIYNYMRSARMMLLN